MHNSFINKAKLLNESMEPYATAFIVSRKIPSSGKPGDRALITQDGHIHGWIGGGCTRGIVLKEALLSLKDGKPRLVKISPEAQIDLTSNTKIYTMTCQSGGEVEVYIEPVLPMPHLLIFGNSHIAMALAKIAHAMEYQVSAINPNPDKALFPTANHLIALKDFNGKSVKENAYPIVCTQGVGDAEALHKAIQIGSPNLSFVASRTKANSIFRELKNKGIEFDQLKKVKTPAGLDIGAKTPHEVAISILAQIIQDFRTETKETIAEKAAPLEIKNEDFYMNPVCNIPVQKSTAKHVLDYKGEKLYFCCDGCKVSFENAPEKYMEVG